jgi:hypothetical protein
MATILLIGSDATDQENLASKLRRRGHAVLLADNRRNYSTDWTARRSTVEIALFDVTSLDDDCKHRSDRICRWPKKDGFPILVLCFTRSCRGPRFEFEIESLGARFVNAG